MGSIGSKIIWLVVGTALIVTALMTVLAYSSARQLYLEGIDRQLRAAVQALPMVIGDEYLARATGGEAIDDASYDALVLRLSELADNSGVYYLYAFGFSDGAALNLTTSASAAEREAEDWPRLRDPYEQPPDALLAVFADGRTRFTEYTDEFGSFRSIFVLREVNGAKYIVGADVTLGQIHADLAALVARRLAAGGVVAALCGVVGVLLARRIAEPIRQLAREVQSWSARDFARDEKVLKSLEQLRSDHRDETGELALQFIGVQNRLQMYLQEWTDATAARQKIEHQIEIARSIQEGLLPHEPPRIENFQIYGWSQPADQTGGDYFDWVKLADGRVMLTIGDVTGHGIGPALVTAASRAYARATANSTDALHENVASLNNLLHGDLRGERFVTLVACLLDPATRGMMVVAAGHGPIMYYSRRLDAVSTTLSSHGLPLGIVDGADYEAATELQFEPGDAMVLVSDGFFEWLNSSGESFGINRLQQSVLASCREDPSRVIDRLRRDLDEFHGGTVQADDTTALIVHCIA